MNIKLAPGWLYRAAIVALAVWVLHSFVEALLAACVAAIASWPLYKRFASRLAPRVGRSTTSLLFTLLMIVFVLAPLIFAFGALLTETQAMLVDIAAADKAGFAVPGWLPDVPLAGSWLASRWQHELAHPGAVTMWTQRTDPAALLAWAQSLGQFMARHAFITGFAVLLLFFLYQEGEALAAQFRRVLRHAVGERAECYVDLGAKAVRASVNSMLIVGLFDGLASAAALCNLRRPPCRAMGRDHGRPRDRPLSRLRGRDCVDVAIGHEGRDCNGVVVAGAWAASSCMAGDKIVRPVIAGNGVHLRFVWVLMGCLGGFEALGLVGLVVGPVALTLTRELWQQRVRDIAAADDENRTVAQGRPDSLVSLKNIQVRLRRWETNDELQAACNRSACA